MDYEPFANDQTGLLETEGQDDSIEEYGEEQVEYDGEVDEETQAFNAKLEGLLEDDLGINMVFLLSEKFRATEGQESTMEGDILS